MANGKAWTPEEDRVLREHLPKHGPGWDGWARLLPGRSRHAIAARKVVLGIAGPRSRPKPRERWTDAQRLLLAKKALEMTRETRHSLNECVAQLDQMVREHRKGLL
jgi:hypothetical protein